MILNKILLTEVKLAQKINFLIQRGFSVQSPWDIVSSVCVERLPIVTPPLNDIQKRFKELLYTIEVEKSMRSDHEIKHENDLKQAELLKKESADIDLEVVSKITAQDFVDACNEELSRFQFATIETGADKKGDKTSIDRSLQRHLVLVIDKKLGNDIKTILPQGIWQEGETLRQTAERVISEECGSELKVKFLSNAPSGFYKYKYPSEINGKIGAKVFFYYANYESGLLAGNLKAYWLTRSEMKEMLPDQYNKSVNEFLIQETY